MNKQGVDIMKYINAAEVLPEHLLTEIQKHINGEILYIPSADEHTRWGEKNGSRSYFENRNREIKQRYQNGFNIEELSHEYGLAYDTVRKIVYKRT
jgi:Mor family transcriptional regulator